MCQQDNSKSYGRIFLKFWGYVGNGTNYQWLNFGGDPEGILDSGSLWNFCYHCIKGGIRGPLAKRRWWRHLANNIALAEVHAGYDCFLVTNVFVVAWDAGRWSNVWWGNYSSWGIQAVSCQYRRCFLAWWPVLWKTWKCQGFLHVTEMSAISVKIRELSGKKSYQGKLPKNIL